MGTAAIELPAEVTRDELYALIWAEPMTKVAPRFGLSDVGLAKLCKRYQIPRPPVGYWAQKEVGKQPEKTPLPELDEGTPQTIEFLAFEKADPVPKPAVTEKVADPQLKALVEFELQPENRIIVDENVVKFHTLVRETKAAMKQTSWHRQNLYSPSSDDRRALLDIQVGEASLVRSYRLMDALVRAFEKRGHKIVTVTREYRDDVHFSILEEQFSLHLREKTKMIRVSEVERKKDYYSNRVKYEPSGDLELQLNSKQTGMVHATWKDTKRTKLESRLNDVMIEFVVGVESARNWRDRQKEAERLRREEEIKRWQEAEERRQEQKRVDELNQMIQKWNQAKQIRDFMADVRSTIEQRDGPIGAGSDLARWMAWALGLADRTDPLGARPQQIRDNCEPRGSRPNQPR